MNQIIQNPWVILLVYVITLLGLPLTILAIVITIKDKKKKSIACIKRSFVVVKDYVNSINGLDILYLGNKIENLTVTNFLIWNAGNEIINFNDMASADPLMVVSNKKILEAKIIFQKKPINKFSVLEFKDSCLKLGFDYMGPGDGLIIKFTHVGKSNYDLMLRGTIKGGSDIKQKSFISIFNKEAYSSLFLSYEKPLPYSKKVKILTKFIVIYCIILVCLGILVFSFDKFSLFERIIGLTIIFIIILITGVSMFKILRGNIPNGFEAFGDDL